MKPKNMRRYMLNYKDVSSDQYIRVMEYLNTTSFTKKDANKFYNEVRRIRNMEEEYIKIVLDIIPEPTPRPRLSKYGTFYVKNSRTNNEFVRLLMTDKVSYYHYITTPCKFIVDNYFPIPNGMNKVEALLSELKLGEHISLPDWDNLGKTYSDMVQKYLLANDSLIVEGISRKFYSLKPRVEITIIYKTDYALEYNKRLVIKRSKLINKGSERNNENGKKDKV